MEKIAQYTVMFLHSGLQMLNQFDWRSSLFIICTSFAFPALSMASERTSPYQRCGVNDENQTLRDSDQSRECRELRTLAKEFNYARECDLHENNTINMSRYDPAMCRAAMILKIRKAMNGAYSSTLFAPLRYPEGAEAVDFMNPQQERVSRERFNQAFGEEFMGESVRVNGRAYEVTKTEATFFIDDVCTKQRYLPVQQILREIDSLSKYAYLYQASCNSGSKMRFHARPTMRLSE